ncbi:MAG: hypothetical protein IPM48_03880 [Saprospiraceae bacterium]|nr:hypothetical protein [Saprospiraceae bacterium]
MSQQIKTIQAIFNLVLRPHEIPFFKKEILHLQNPKNDVWHNHIVEQEDHDFEQSVNVRNSKIQGKNLRRYPQIQFRTEYHMGHTCACLWGIGKGADEIVKFLKKKPAFEIPWGRGRVNLHLLDLIEQKMDPPKIWNQISLKKYSLTHFLPFNEDRYKEFKSKLFFVDKLELIERMATHNLVLFMEEFFPEQKDHFKITAKTIDLKGFKTAKYHPKDSPDPLTYVSVDLHLGINADLPAGISIGNLKALGYGILRPVEDKPPKANKVV